MAFEDSIRADGATLPLFRLTLTFFDGRPGLSESFARIDDLASRLDRLRVRGALSLGIARAYGRRGDLLDLRRLLARGAWISATLAAPGRGGWWRGADIGYERRRGPLHGVRCFRGGGGHYRRVATLGAKRDAQVAERGSEPAPRAARGVNALPDSWDDFARGRSHCWKKQRKGAKAWDRPGSSRAYDRRAAWTLFEDVFDDVDESIDV